jgi:hypothetical protein
MHGQTQALIQHNRALKHSRANKDKDYMVHGEASASYAKQLHQQQQ